MAYVQHGRSILRRGKILKDSALVQTYDGAFHHPLLYAIQGVRYRKLEVILTTTIDKLGKAGETVKVAPGHFRNHLMPKLLAVPNIDKFAYLISEQRKRTIIPYRLTYCFIPVNTEFKTIYEPKEAEEVKVVPKTVEDTMKEYQTAATRLDNAKLVLRRFVKIDKDLRSPVEKEEIVAEVARQLGISIEPENLQLTTPLSTLGEFEVPLRLPKAIPLPEGKVQWTLDVKIRKK